VSAPRPPVSVVMPFAGSRADAERALNALLELDTEPDDELILSDNAGVAPAREGVLVVLAVSERSPSHARNVGAEHATRDWVLFLDADCRAEPGLIARYFDQPIAAEVGALAGEVVASADGASLAARYGATRNFLGQSAHLSHPYLPRAVSANLLVRRAAFEQVGGFFERVRAAEDTDFSWRLQRAGWTLEARPRARVEHQYRTTVDALRRQWRGYAAGRAWLGRRYEDFDPEPAIQRAGGRLLRRGSGRRQLQRSAPDAAHVGMRDRGRFLALDALLGVEELAGMALSNRPGTAHGVLGPVHVVLVAEHFPPRGDPLSDFARTLAGARVEAIARPEAFDPRIGRELTVHYREDDGTAARRAALVRLVVRHPVRAALDPVRRRRGDPKLAALAPAALRLIADPGARVHALGGNEARETARRLATLAGRALEDS
jgi:hypothetical protein